MKGPVFAGLVFLILQVVTAPVHAQDCGISNWSQATNLDSSFTGVQGPNNRRYGGPCGLRVQLDGQARFLTDQSPLNEPTFIARFYVHLDAVSSTDPVWLYSADNGAEDLIQVWYNTPSAGDLTLSARDTAGTLHDLTFANIAPGWHSVEFVWESAASADIRFALSSDDPEADLVTTIDTSGLLVANASVGNLNAATGGSFDFDDYVSRRISRPGRLLVADADDDSNINIADIIAIADEIEALGFAPGQPDCDEDGEIDPTDVACVVTILDNQ
ncbi:MAG: hypothetical protein EA370_16700 [Wenzhouxiangella sp.]|nr:MAG: hypothetical protein EA370_16700 [Wenzhouxiangella sp.]